MAVLDIAVLHVDGNHNSGVCYLYNYRRTVAAIRTDLYQGIIIVVGIGGGLIFILPTGGMNLTSSYHRTTWAFPVSEISVCTNWSKFFPGRLTY